MKREIIQIGFVEAGREPARVLDCGGKRSATPLSPARKLFFTREFFGQRPNLLSERGSVTRSRVICKTTCCGSQSRAPQTRTLPFFVRSKAVLPLRSATAATVELFALQKVRPRRAGGTNVVKHTPCLHKGVAPLHAALVFRSAKTPPQSKTPSVQPMFTGKF